MMQTPVRLAILGCGFAAQQIHIPRLVRIPGSFKIVGVADIRTTAAEQAAELAGGCPTFTDLERMLGEVRPQALVVLTPLHAAPIEIALQGGLDVFAEKPLCETPADALRLTALATELQRVLVVGAMRVFDPAIALAKEIVAEISPLRWVEIARLLRRRHGNWRRRPGRQPAAGWTACAGRLSEEPAAIPAARVHPRYFDLARCFWSSAFRTCSPCLSRRVGCNRGAAASGRHTLLVRLQ